MTEDNRRCIEHLSQRATDLEEEARALESELSALCLPLASSGEEQAMDLLRMIPPCCLSLRVQVREILAQHQEDTKSKEERIQQARELRRVAK